METIFTWDPAKAHRNEQIHGISFEKAAEVFADAFIVTARISSTATSSAGTLLA